jgi:hypothetical protein
VTQSRIPTYVNGASLVLAPLLGLAAACSLPALRNTRGEEIAAIAQAPGRFYLYAICILLSSYLMVPAFFGIMGLLRPRHPRWAYLAGGLAQFGLLVAIGDAATELMYWQMGARSADPAQMVALADRYEDAAGSSLIYAVGGLAVLAGTVLTAVALWRSRVVPRWTAVAIVVGALGNIGGFASASLPTLVASYLVLMAAFWRIAAVVLAGGDRADEPVDVTDRPAAVAPAP